MSVRSIFWVLLLACFGFTAGSYAWASYVNSKVITEVVINERSNVKEHAEIKKCITEYIIPIKEAVARIETKVEKL